MLEHFLEHSLGCAYSKRNGIPRRGLPDGAAKLDRRHLEHPMESDFGHLLQNGEDLSGRPHFWPSFGVRWVRPCKLARGLGIS